MEVRIDNGERPHKHGSRIESWLVHAEYVSSDRERAWSVFIFDGRFTCNCPDQYFRGIVPDDRAYMCKHIRRLAEEATRRPDRFVR